MDDIAKQQYRKVCLAHLEALRAELAEHDKPARADQLSALRQLADALEHPPLHELADALAAVPSVKKYDGLLGGEHVAS